MLSPHNTDFPGSTADGHVPSIASAPQLATPSSCTEHCTTAVWVFGMMCSETNLASLRGEPTCACITYCMPSRMLAVRLPSTQARVGGLSRRVKPPRQLHRTCRPQATGATSGYPLHDAVAGQQIEALQALLADGFDPNTAADGDNVRGHPTPYVLSRRSCQERERSPMISGWRQSRPFHHLPVMPTPG